MNSLEEYIKSHSAEFDAELPSADAEAKFLGRFEEGGTRLRPRSALTRGRGRVLRLALPAAAAAAAALLLALPPRPGARDWLRAAGDTPEDVYLCYMSQVTKAWEKAGTDEDRSRQLQSITEESIPLADQLPDELSDEEKAAILHDYYNTLLDGVYTLLERTE